MVLEQFLSGLPGDFWILLQERKLISLCYTATVALDLFWPRRVVIKLPPQAVHICKKVQLLVIRDSPKETYS